MLLVKLCLQDSFDGCDAEKENSAAPMSGILRPVGEYPKRRARFRLILPPWLDAWPRGLRPEAAYLDAGRVEFLYRAPDSRWFLVGLWPGARVSEGWGPNPADLRRLSVALQRRLARSPHATKWLQDMVRFYALLLTLPSFGGARIDAPLRSLDALLQRSAQIRSVQIRSAQIRSRQGGEPNLSFVRDAPGPRALARIDDLRIGMRLASAQFREALEEADAAPVGEDGKASNVRGALIASLEGRVDAARQASLRAKEQAGEPGAFAAAQLLERLGHTKEAIACLSSSLSLAGGGAAFERARRVAMMAAATGARDAAANAAQRMEGAATSRNEKRACAEAWIGAGEFDKAEHQLRELLQTQPAAGPAEQALGGTDFCSLLGEDAAAATSLATLLVWKGAAGEAAELLRPQVERAPSHEMLRTLGAAEYLLGHWKESLRHLNAALTMNPEDHHARLWRAEVLGASGELDAACSAIREVALGDQVAWQLVRALLEEQHAPGRRIADDTWFIVDALLQALLGDEARRPLPPIERRSWPCAAGSRCSEATGV